MIRHSSPFQIQEIRTQSCTMGIEIKDWLGRKQAVSLATTPTSFEDDKLGNQLNN